MALIFVCIFSPPKFICQSLWQSVLLLQFSRENEKRVWTRLNQKLWFLRGRHFPPRTVSCPPGGCASSFKYLLDTSVWRGGRWAEVSSDERVMGDVRRARSSTCSPLALQGHPIPCVSVARCAPHIIWRRSVFTFFVILWSVMYGVQTL